MIELPLTQDAEDYGRRVKKRYDAQRVKDAFCKVGPDKRWTGHAVEYELRQWMVREGIPHHWNGGLDSKPDFIIGGSDGMKVAVKSNSGDGPRDDFTFVVQECDLKKLGDGVLFCVVQLRERKIWIAGYMDANRFRRESEKRRRGDEGFLPGRPIEYDCRTIRADALEQAETFFALLEVACA
jgi:hypothetical protein